MTRRDATRESSLPSFLLSFFSRPQLPDYGEGWDSLSAIYLHLSPAVQPRINSAGFAFFASETPTPSPPPPAYLPILPTPAPDPSILMHQMFPRSYMLSFWICSRTGGKLWLRGRADYLFLQTIQQILWLKEYFVLENGGV